MNLITILWCAGVGANLTLAAIHLIVWIRDKTRRSHLAYAILAIAVTAMAVGEMAVMGAETGEQIGTAIRWLHVPIFVIMASLVAFVQLDFRTGRAWLGHAAWGLRFVSLILNFLLSPNVNYSSITGVSHVRFLGELVSVPVGVPSLWTLVPQLSGWLLIAFTVDASVRLWRQGDGDRKHRAVFVGGAISLFLLIAFSRGLFIVFGNASVFLSFLFLIMAAVMGYELGLDVLRATQLTRQLQASEAALRESEERMAIAADAARLGMWIWDISANRIWLTDKCRELYAYSSGNEVTYDDVIRRLHPDDRDAQELAIARALETKSQYATEYRIVLPDGSLRWIACYGRVESDHSGKVKRMLGASIDVSEQRETERAARELSGRLINAQEDERRRIARDLHDDLNQRLALLALEIDRLGGWKGSHGRPGVDTKRLADQVRELSSDVHNLSHQLHPAMLHQLGLVVAARSWCRGLAQQSGLSVDFFADNAAQNLQPEVALCLYRIVQESLNNVVRHSGARAARVELAVRADCLKLTITDVGQGFDARAERQRGGLGLVSMQERVRLLRGTLAVHSSPGNGTRVEASVPLSASSS